MSQSSPAPVQRLKLDASSAFITEMAARNELQVVVAMALDEIVEEERWRTLLKVMQDRHDIFKTVITRDAKGDPSLELRAEVPWVPAVSSVDFDDEFSGTTRLSTDPASWAGAVTARDVIAGWHAQALALGHEPLDENGPLIRVTLCRYPRLNKTFALWVIHHALYDSDVIVRIFDELALDTLRLYGPEEGVISEEEAERVLNPGRTFLPDSETFGSHRKLRGCMGSTYTVLRSITMIASGMLRAKQIPKTPKLTAPPAGVTGERSAEAVHTFQLSADLTARLRTVAKEQGNTNVWGLMCAISQVTAYEQAVRTGLIPSKRCGCLGERRKDRVFVAAEMSMRALSRDPVPVTSERGMGLWATQMVFHAPAAFVDTREELFDLARRCRASMVDAVAKKRIPWLGERIAELVLAGLGTRKAVDVISKAAPVPLIAFNNVGVVKPVFKPPDQARVVDGIYWFGGGSRPDVGAYLEFYVITPATSRGPEMCITIHNNAGRFPRDAFVAACERFKALLMLAVGGEYAQVPV